MSTEVAEKGFPAFTCQEARLVLTSTPSNQDVDVALNERHSLKSAAHHYAGCGECQALGMSEITNRILSCREALEVWAGMKMDFDSIPFGGARNIIEVLAQEHIFGRECFTTHERLRCKERSCQGVSKREGVIGHGRSLNYTRFPLLIEIFKKEGWDLSTVFKFQRETLMKIGCSEEWCTMKGAGWDCNVSCTELFANICGMQALIRRSEIPTD